MNYTHITFEQRYHIELGWRKGLVVRVALRSKNRLEYV